VGINASKSANFIDLSLPFFHLYLQTTGIYLKNVNPLIINLMKIRYVVEVAKLSINFRR